MGKNDTQATATTPGGHPGPHDRDHDLIEALTKAIVASRRDTPEASPEAKAAAKQYGDIKRALGTHAEPFPTSNSSRACKE